MRLIFQANTVSDFLKSYLESLPNRGRGEMRRIAESTGIHTTTMSQILKGERSFSLEQGVQVGEYLGFDELELKYLLCLIQIERAGTDQLRRILQAELKSLKEKSSELVFSIRKDKILNESEKAQFYSNWFYSGIAVFCSLETPHSIESLMASTGLSKQRVKQVVSFLLQSGICIERDGILEPGSRSTHLESTSPWISRHHANWRIKAMEKHPSLSESELAYSSPMSLSAKDAKKIREVLMQTVKDVVKIRDPSPCEEAWCLNMDWFRI
jgi:predicted transcriptional regulator